MPLRIGVRIDHIVGTQETPPGLRITILVNGREALIEFTPWMELVMKRSVLHKLRLGDDGISKQRIKRAAKSQERSTAEALGGFAQTGSGNRPGHKGDGRVFGRFRIENKFTRAKEFRLKLAELRKIRSECAGQEIPVFNVQFREEGTLKVLDSWALVPWSSWEKWANATRNDS